MNGIQNEDGLRLLALSRIPRCTVCPRLAALQTLHGDGSRGPIPGPPRTCTTRYCAPLVKRYGQSSVEFLPDELPAGGYSSRPQASTAKTL